MQGKKKNNNNQKIPKNNSNKNYTDHAKLMKETFSEGPKDPNKYMEKQAIFPAAKYQKSVNPPPD